MATAQWQVFDSSKDETHCSSPGRPSSTSFHGVVGRPAGSPDICESPPRQPDQVCRSASNQSASTHSGQPRRTSTQGTGTPQTPLHRVFWPPRLLRARVDWKSGETGEGGRDFGLLDTLSVYKRPPNREWTAISWSPGRGAGPFRRGRQCLSRKGDRPRSSTPCRGGHTAGIPQGRPRRSGGGAQNRAFVLAHLLPPVMNKFPLPARVAADSVSAGSGSRDPANSGRPPAEYR